MLPSLAAIAKAISYCATRQLSCGCFTSGNHRSSVPDCTSVDDISRADRCQVHYASSIRRGWKLSGPAVMEGACDSISQTIVGNGKKVDLSVNTGVLQVIGNSCFVTITRNEGQIMITGNKVHLQITENAGCISYTGNHGLIEVGRSAKGTGQVVYVGNGGSVKRMKNGVSGKCGVEGSSTNDPPPSKSEDRRQTRTADVQSEVTVNGVQVCISSGSKKDIHQGVTKENINPEKVQNISTTPADCYLQNSRKVWLRACSKNGDQKSSGVKASRRRNIPVADPANPELLNWCLNLTTGLFPV